MSALIKRLAARSMTQNMRTAESLANKFRRKLTVRQTWEKFESVRITQKARTGFRRERGQ